jgi:hypothetical protein
MAYGTVNADVIGTSVANSNLGAGNASAYKNRLINGAQAINQYNGTTAVTPNIDGYYYTDRFINQSSAIRSATTLQQVSITNLAGFNYATKFTNNSNTSVATTDYYALGQMVEGYNWADMNWGTANAKTVTFSCWVFGSIAGTFGGLIKEGSQTRSYPFLYTISTPNTWTQVSVTIPGDTSGTYIISNGRCIWIELSLAAGSSYTGTPNAWNSSVNVGATGQSNSYLTTTGATFYATGWQLEVGSFATGFDYRPYGTELNLCYRYFYKNPPSSYSCFAVGTIDSATTLMGMVTVPVPMRVAPTLGTTGTPSDYFIRWSGSQTTTANAVPSLSAQAVGANTYRIDCGTGGGMTTGYSGVYVSSNNAGYLSYSAEL